MYKVFIYDKPVYITSDANFEVENCQQLEGVIVDKLIQQLEDDQVNGIVVKVQDEKKAWKAFKKAFKYIKAAGGMVYNQEGDLLVIYRLGKWDLPKGKMEKGEDVETCAIREVEEECNVSGISIKRELPSSYHCYPYKGKWALKRTYWFEMVTEENMELIPQKEEGIEAVEWLPVKDIQKVLKNTYRSIEEVIKSGLA